MSDNLYPKVLILGPFNQTKPTGITINNLFSCWPKNKLAVAAFSNISIAYTPNISDYYLFGKKEIKYIFPFNLLFKVNDSKVYSNLNYSEKTTPAEKTKLQPLKIFYNWITQLFVNKSGLFLVKRKIKLSNQFEDWLVKLNPDIVYCSIEDINTISFLKSIKEKTNAKIAIHVMDDWFHSIYYLTIFKEFWKKKLKKSFAYLLTFSDINIAISEKMAQEYNKKYKKKFYVFHNPIDLKEWDKPMTSNKKNSNFVFIFTGKINRDTYEPINDFIDSIEELKSIAKVEFKIYTTTEHEKLYSFFGNKIDKYNFGSVNRTEIPNIIKNADGLLLPLSFNNRNIKYTRLSMPTKMTEYMVSGNPIFLYAPDNIAVTEYLNKNNAAFIVCKTNELKNKLIQFVNRNYDFSSVVNNAYKLAIAKHEKSYIQRDLLALLNKTPNN